MKRLKLVFATLAILVAVGGAISTNATSHKAVVTTGTTLYWYDNELGSGSPVSGTREERMDITDCKSTEVFCEAGYAQNQFVDNNPANGLKPNQEPQDIIYKLAE